MELFQICIVLAAILELSSGIAYNIKVEANSSFSCYTEIFRNDTKKTKVIKLFLPKGNLVNKGEDVDSWAISIPREEITYNTDIAPIEQWFVKFNMHHGLNMFTTEGTLLDIMREPILQWVWKLGPQVDITTSLSQIINTTLTKSPCASDAGILGAIYAPGVSGVIIGITDTGFMTRDTLWYNMTNTICAVLDDDCTGLALVDLILINTRLIILTTLGLFISADLRYPTGQILKSWEVISITELKQTEMQTQLCATARSLGPPPIFQQTNLIHAQFQISNWHTLISCFSLQDDYLRARIWYSRQCLANREDYEVDYVGLSFNKEKTLSQESTCFYSNDSFTKWHNCLPHRTKAEKSISRRVVSFIVDYEQHAGIAILSQQVKGKNRALVSVHSLKGNELNKQRKFPAFWFPDPSFIPFGMFFHPDSHFLYAYGNQKARSLSPRLLANEEQLETSRSKSRSGDLHATLMVSCSTPPAVSLSGPTGPSGSKPSSPMVCLDTESDQGAQPSPHMAAPPAVSPSSTRGAGLEPDPTSPPASVQMRQQGPAFSASDSWLSTFPQLVYNEASNTYMLPVQPEHLLLLGDQRRQLPPYPATQQPLSVPPQRPSSSPAVQQPHPSSVPSSHRLPPGQLPASPRHSSPSPSLSRHHLSHDSRRHSSHRSHRDRSSSAISSPARSQRSARSQRRSGELQNPHLPSSPASPPSYCSLSQSSSSDSDSDLDWSPSRLKPSLNNQSSSPSDDVRAFTDQILRMARALEFSVTEPDDDEPSDQLEKRARSRLIERPAIPYMPSLAKTLDRSWNIPTSASHVSKRMDNLYRIADPKPAWMLIHPAQNSDIVEGAQHVWISYDGGNLFVPIMRLTNETIVETDTCVYSQAIVFVTDKGTIYYTKAGMQRYARLRIARAAFFSMYFDHLGTLNHISLNGTSVDDLVVSVLDVNTLLKEDDLGFNTALSTQYITEEQMIFCNYKSLIPGVRSITFSRLHLGKVFIYG
ncbi:hypothetical protein JD844_020861 [Phrynosoma platyrhinos]|uniref:Uncharacterized protein n=1 Tax=Phrynosoma platyrhinos TaxID=52577 RepID=A0ABQ7SSN3_PHRPL|nr:hypothetical protein JD844_020861 [Phrynosoma platyrhinos]